MPYSLQQTLFFAALSSHRHHNVTNTNRLDNTVVREMYINRVDFLVVFQEHLNEKGQVSTSWQNAK